MPAPRHDLPPQYDPAAVEAGMYERWREAGVFAPRDRGDPYVIMIPPPNVTAVLHMGHGLNYWNVKPIVRIPGVEELNIGHSIVSRAVLVGMVQAVRDMKAAMTEHFPSRR